MKKVAMLAVLAGAAAANAAVLSSNPQDFGANFGLGFYSDGAPGYFYSQQIAENFSLSVASNITGVNFSGASEFFSFPDYTNITGFNVQILADAGGVPGEVIYSEVVTSAGSALQGVNALGSNVYKTSATFSSPINNLAAGNYWVSIGGILANGFGDAWVWADGTVDDGIAYTFNPNGGGWTAYNDGSTSGTFEIVGTEVPAPAGLGLLGLAGIAAGRRRR